ncbi:RICIN domain-containing protein [Streptomyces sp. XD-27]|uniref:RICIN domain-containing protein n=1 Tax=Streptomyces sp. XD-27 TaxID=3062779 RepID=UPI0026F47E5B|nr:hypothetical protein [Streptomyces sp. XD-27]WKX73775.1 hypothetical protein Q3Y56_31380 [Streptomyces sp. XD-27]
MPGAPDPQGAESTTAGTSGRRVRVPGGVRGRLAVGALTLAVLLGGGYAVGYAVGYTVWDGPSGDAGDRPGASAANRRQAPSRTVASPMPEKTSDAASLPLPGAYRIRSALSSLCLSEKADSESGNVYQSHCRDSIPAYSVEAAGGGTYWIHSLHPVFDEGCLGVARGSTEAGAGMTDDYCGHRGKAERFRLEEVRTPVRGYRIKPSHTGHCLAAPGATPWSRVVQFPCAAGDRGQVFRFEPVGR